MATFPDLPPFFNFIYTNKDGSLTPNAQLYNDLMYQVLNQVINSFNNGLFLPNATTAQIAAHGNDATVPLGTLWFNSSLGKLQFKSAANTIQTVTST